MLIFFDLGARANFISPKLAAPFRGDGVSHETSLATLNHYVAITPIIGKPRLHVQSYVNFEEFYIMPWDGCDVLLTMPWCQEV